MKTLLFSILSMLSITATANNLGSLSPYDSRKSVIDEGLKSRIEELQVLQDEIGRKALAAGNVREQVPIIMKGIGGRFGQPNAVIGSLENAGVSSDEISDDQVRSAAAAIKAYFKSYDDYNRAFVDLLAEREVRTAEFFLHSSNEKIAQAAADVVKFTQAYEANKHKFYENTDFDRLIPFREIHKASRKLKFAVDKAAGLDPEKAPSEKKYMLKYAAKAIKFFAQLLTKKHSEEGKTPALDTIRGALYKMGERAGYTLKWNGLENVPKLEKPNGRDVYLFTHTHHNAVLDNFALAHLPIYGIGSVGSADLTFPHWIVNLMLNCDEFTVTSRGDDIREFKKMVRVLKEKRLNGYVVPSEGMAAAGYEIRPMRKKVTDFLVHGLWKEGFRVHLIPVAYRDNFRFGSIYHFVAEDLPREVEGYVAPIITDEMLRRLLQITGSDEAIRDLVRAQWHMPLVNDGVRIESQPNIREMLGNVDKYVAGNIR